MSKNNIMKITTIMIILLVIALVFIFMHYVSYREDTVIKKPITTPINVIGSGEIDITKISGETKAETIDSGEDVTPPVEAIEKTKESVKEDLNNKELKDEDIFRIKEKVKELEKQILRIIEG